jgi:hypothetical protein
MFKETSESERQLILRHIIFTRSLSNRIVTPSTLTNGLPIPGNTSIRSTTMSISALSSRSITFARRVARTLTTSSSSPGQAAEPRSTEVGYQVESHSAKGTVSAGGAHVAVEVKRHDDVDAVKQLTGYLELLNRDPILAPVHGVLATATIMPRRERWLKTAVSGAWFWITTGCVGSNLKARCSNPIRRRTGREQPWITHPPEPSGSC